MSKALVHSWLLKACTAAALAVAGVTSGEPVSEAPALLVFDTDMGNDIDDALALGVIHALASRGECKLAAVTITKDHPLSAPYVDAVNTFYGRGDVAIGVVRNGPTPEPSLYTGLAQMTDDGRLRYPHDLLAGESAPEAVDVLRQTLAAAEDGAVVIVQVGFSTNLARLLRSEPDAASRLPGVELVRRKVRLLSVMGGAFATSGDAPEPEYNVKMDVASAQALVEDWPTSIVFSGLEIGLAVTFPAESIERDFDYTAHHPLAESYRLHSPPTHNRPSWDLTSVLYALRPTAGYFDLSPPGRVRVANSGATTFEPEAKGPHRRLILRPAQQPRVREALVQLASQPPTAVGAGSQRQ